MHVLRPLPALGLALIVSLAGVSAAGASGSLGPAALRAQHASLGPQLASNALRGPLVLKSEEASRRIEGDLYAVLDHPFAAVSAALADPAQWCDILILHLNNKQCRPEKTGAETVLELRVGQTYKQPVEQASVLRFNWRAPEVRPDYLGTQMVAAVGPYDTQDYRLLAEAVPLDGNHTFLHMAYSLGYGTAGLIALNLYFGTAGRDKVGFSPAEPVSASSPYVGGTRGLVERNTMRYFLAIDAYLQALSAPLGERLERRMEAWFDATEKYPRQLHEMGRAEYLRMKRSEVQRQTVSR
jgi:hypothetical protein